MYQFLEDSVFGSVLNKFENYMQIMEAALIKLYGEVNKAGTLSPEQKQVAFNGISKIVDGKIDYSSKSARTNLYKELSVPFVQVENTFMGNVNCLHEDSKSGSSIIDTVLNKIAAGMNRFVGWENEKTIGIAKKSAVVFGVLIFSGVAAYTINKILKDGQLKKIVVGDTNPLIKSLAKAIIDGKVKSTYEISSFVREIEASVKMKHSSILY